MICDECKKPCPTKGPPQNVIMDKAGQALKRHCNQGIVPETPMDWIRGWIKGTKCKRE